MSSSIDLRAEIQASRVAITGLQRELEALKLTLGREQERLSLLERLEALESGSISTARGGVEVHSGARSLEDAVVEFLQSMKKPMHISMIRQYLEREAVPIPGKGVDANVITRIGRDHRITRSPGKRGYYILREGIPKHQATNA